MGRYNFENFSDHHWPKDIRANLETLVDEARRGELTEARFYELAGLEPSEWGSLMHTGFRDNPHRTVCLMMMRSKYCLHLSFAVFTTEYLESLTRLLSGLRVHEVCARNGLLSSLMAHRGIDWSCSDLEPQADDVEALDGMEAMEQHKPDVVFASWIDYGFDLDQRLAARVPCVFVHESCTGTTDGGFYDNDAYEVINVPGWFQDVPNWSGIRDHTILTVPRGGSNPFNTT